MAANALLDRGWGKAAQFVDVQGEIKQLVAVQLNVVRSDSIAHNPSAILPTVRRRRATRPPSNSRGMLGSSFRPPAGAIWRGDPVKTTS